MLTDEEKKLRKKIYNRKYFKKWYSKKENKKKQNINSLYWFTTDKGKKYLENHPYQRKLPPLEVRFWRKVLKKSSDLCWEWKGVRYPTGYGHLGKKYAHRLSWELHFGEIPFGLCICHTCDNPPCVNPNHLFIGTQKDNMRDRDRKKRDRWSKTLVLKST